MYKILLIEDDENLREQVKSLLECNNYNVYIVTDFRKVIDKVQEVIPDLIILDINLPYMDGNYYCHKIRKKYNMPIIVTSARNSDTDQILSMELGSDDYVIKPFNINVLLSRIAACLRRTYGEYHKNQMIQNGGFLLDQEAMKLIYKDKSRELSKNEYKLLKVFFNEPDKVITREVLLDAIWDDKDFVDDNTLTVNVTRLKKIFEEFGHEDVIKTKRGIGYMLCVK